MSDGLGGPVPAPTSGRRTVCITGMHRSGTSVLTRLLNLLGVHLGPRQSMIEPMPDNPEGFWEHQSIVAMNEAVLRRHGGTWSDPPFLRDGWAADPALQPLRDAAAGVLDTALGSVGTVGWKDPRTSMVLPFWRAVCPIPPTVHVVRHPQEVAGSLARRDGFGAERSAYLWLRHVVAVCRDDPGALTVGYEDILTDPEGTAARLMAFYDLRTPDEDTLEQIRSSVRQDLRRSDRIGDGPTMALAEALHTRLRTGHPDDVAALAETLHQRWAAAARQDRRARGVVTAAYRWVTPGRLLGHQPFRTAVGGLVSVPLQRATRRTTDHASAAAVA